MREWIKDKFDNSKEWVMDRKEERTSLDEPTIPVRINETINTGIKLNFAYGIII